MVAAVSYQVRLANLEHSSPLLFDDDWLEDFDDFELERVETSPLLSLASGELYLPWDGIYYAGRYKVTLFAVDQNWFDLVRTDNVNAERGSGEAGQSFQRPLFHVENGIGHSAIALGCCCSTQRCVPKYCSLMWSTLADAIA